MLRLGEVGADLEAGGFDAQMVVVSTEGRQLFFCADPLCFVCLPSRLRNQQTSRIFTAVIELPVGPHTAVRHPSAVL